MMNFIGKFISFVFSIVCTVVIMVNIVIFGFATAQVYNYINSPAGMMARAFTGKNDVQIATEMYGEIYSTLGEQLVYYVSTK